MYTEWIARYWIAQAEELNAQATKPHLDLHGFTSAKATDGTWTEQSWGLSGIVKDELAGRLREWYDRHAYENIYFSARIFHGTQRSNQTVTRSSFLYADLDEADLNVGEYPPVLYWETSPGMAQAIWRAPYLLHNHEPWNRALTYELGADKGGWHGSKMLRVPGSINWKRATQEAGGSTIVPVGTVILDAWTNELGWLPDVIKYPSFDVLVSLSNSSGLADVPQPPTKGEWDEHIKHVWKGLPMSLKARLEQGVVADRSLFLWMFYQSAKDNGLSKEDVFKIVWHMPWNKFDQPHRLWADINKAWEE